MDSENRVEKPRSTFSANVPGYDVTPGGSSHSKFSSEELRKYLCGYGGKEFFSHGGIEIPESCDETSTLRLKVNGNRSPPGRELNISMGGYFNTKGLLTEVLLPIDRDGRIKIYFMISWNNGITIPINTGYFVGTDNTKVNFFMVRKILEHFAIKPT